MSKRTLEYVDNEINRYEAQQEALQVQEYPEDQQENKTTLDRFYKEKLQELHAERDQLSSRETRAITVKHFDVVVPHRPGEPLCGKGL